MHEWNYEETLKRKETIKSFNHFLTTIITSISSDWEHFLTRCMEYKLSICLWFVSVHKMMKHYEWSPLWIAFWNGLNWCAFLGKAFELDCWENYGWIDEHYPVKRVEENVAYQCNADHTAMRWTSFFVKNHLLHLLKANIITQTFSIKMLNFAFLKKG